MGSCRPIVCLSLAFLVLLLAAGCGGDVSSGDGDGPDGDTGCPSGCPDGSGCYDGECLPCLCQAVGGCCDGCRPRPDGTGCSDGSLCTDPDECREGLCVPGAAVECPAAGPCRLPGECSPATGRCSDPAGPDDVECDDGEYCTLDDRCRAGECEGTAVRNCAAAGDDCNGGVCDEEADACVADPTQREGFGCDDGDPCTHTDRCAGGGCAGLAYACDQGETCEEGECLGDLDAGRDGCLYRISAGRCLIDQRCFAEGDPVQSDGCRICDPATPDVPSDADGAVCLSGADDNPCTRDICDGGSCGHPPDDTAGCSDGLTCSRDECRGGRCVVAGVTDGCLIDGRCLPAGTPRGSVGDEACLVCDPDGPGGRLGWSPAAEGAGCDDGNRLTASDACESGICRGNAWAVVPAGLFDAGSPADEPFRDPAEGPLHPAAVTWDLMVRLAEVTQGEWRSVARDAAAHPGEDWAWSPSAFTACGEECPVERISWWDAAAFCNALSRREGLEECYRLTACRGMVGDDYSCQQVEPRGQACLGYRLPSEAEYEYLARAGSRTALPGGPISLAGCGQESALLGREWYCGSGPVAYAGCADLSSTGGPACAGPRPAGTLAPNGFGLFDMSGNVAEWTNDIARRAYTAYPAIDPVGPEQGARRLVRGGDWSGGAELCRPAYRGSSVDPGSRNDRTGFRPVRSLPRAACDCRRIDPCCDGCRGRNEGGVCDGGGCTPGGRCRSGRCAGPTLPDFVACDDGDPLTVFDLCQDGRCGHADISRDGRPDLLFDNRVTGLMIVRGAPDGYGSAPAYLKHGGAPAHADFDRDGYPDMALSQSGVTHLYPGSSEGFDHLSRRQLLLPGGGSPLAADLDADGRPDLIVPAFGYAGPEPLPTRILYGSAAGPGESRRQSLPPSDAPSVAAADVNGDGRLDLIVPRLAASGSAQPASVVYFAGPDGFDGLSRLVLPAGGSPWAVAADLNRDGHLDLVFSRYAPGGGSTVWYGSTGGFDPDGGIELPTVGAWQVSAADLNRDGWPDLLFSQRYDGYSHLLDTLLFRGGASGPGGYGQTPFPAAGSGFHAVSDLDGDGWWDLVVANLCRAEGLEWCSFERLPSSIYRGGASGPDPGLRADLLDVGVEGVAVSGGLEQTSGLCGCASVGPTACCLGCQPYNDGADCPGGAAAGCFRGECVTRAAGCAGLPDGHPCDDGNPASRRDRCRGGSCMGDPCLCLALDGCCDGCRPVNQGLGCTDADDAFSGDICQDGVCRGFSAPVGYCSQAWCSPVPSTGQTSCYTWSPPWYPTDCRGGPGEQRCAETAGCGQDAQYPGAGQLFSIGGDGGMETLDDPVTGRQWRRAAPGQGGQTAAAAFCDGLVWGGHDDWALPSAQELVGLFDFGISGSGFDPELLPDWPLDVWYWTGSSINPVLRPALNPRTGEVRGMNQLAGGKAACVRGGPPENGEGTGRYLVRSIGGGELVTDLVTGLQWQSGYATDLTWAGALARCEELAASGLSDWRLPDAKELFSLVVFGRSNPAAQIPGMPGPTEISLFFSSTSLPADPGLAWSVDFGFGEAYGYGKELLANARCVRDLE